MKGSMLRLLLQQSVAYRFSQPATWTVYFIWLFMAFIFFGSVLFAILTGKWLAAAKPAAIAFGTMGIYEWVFLSRVTAMLNGPINAGLLPAARKRAMITLATILLLLSLANGLLCGFAFGNYALAGSLSLMVLAGVALLGVARWEGMLLYIAPMMVSAMERSRPGLVDSGMPLVALAVTSVLCGIYMMAQLFPRGERHWRTMARIESAWLKPKSGAAKFAGMKVASSRETLYGRFLANDCRRQDVPGRLMWHVLGPAGHWSSFVRGLLLMVVVFTLIHWILPLLGLSTNFSRGFIGGISIPILLMAQCAHASKIATRLHATRIEQGLMTLTPRMPQNKELNRLFIQQVLLQSTVLFLVPIMLAIVQVVVDGGDSNAMLSALCWTSLTVLLAASLLRWITRTTNPSSILPAIFAVSQILGVAFLYWINNQLFALSLPYMAMACFLLAGFLLWRDIIQLMRGPAIMPLAQSV